MIKYLAILSFAITAQDVAAEIHTCTVNGKTVYQGKPCAGSKALNDKVNQAKANQQARELANHRYEAEMRERSSRKEPKIGMPADAVKKSSWGHPSDVNRTVNSGGVSEQWVYRGIGYSKNRYLHLKNGILYSIDD